MSPATDPPEERATIDALADALFEGGDPESPRDRAAAEAIRRAGAAALMTLANRRDAALRTARATTPGRIGPGDTHPIESGSYVP